MSNIVFAQIQEQPRKQDFAYPYDSSYGIPAPYFWTALIILGYLALRFYISLKKDKKKMSGIDVNKKKKAGKIKNGGHR